MKVSAWISTACFLLFISFVACLGLFLVDTWPTTADWSTHFYWTNQYRRSLDSGVLHPRWVEPSHGGYGSPAFLFYPPVAYLCSAILTYFVSDIWALRLVNLFFFFVGAWGTYRVCRTYADRNLAFLGAAIFTLLPAHLVLLYGDWLFANLSAMALLPWIVLAIIKRSRYLPLLWALLVLTHTMSALLVLPWLAALVFEKHTQNNSSPARAVKYLLGSVLLGSLLAAFYWIPVAAHLNEIRQDVHLSPSWGSAHQNLLFTVDNPKEGEAWPILNWFIGIVQITQFAALISGAIVLWPRWRLGWERALVALASLSLFLMLRPAAFFWKAFPIFGRILGGLPWRLAPPLTLLTSVVAISAFSMKTNPEVRRHRAGRFALVGFLALSMILTLCLFYLAVTLPLKKGDLEKARKYGHWSVFEYRSKYAPHLNEYKKPWDKEIEVLGEKGQGKVTIVSWDPQLRRFKWLSPNKSLLRVRTFYFPGWTAWLSKGGGDWQQVPIILHEPTGGLLLDLPPTKGQTFIIELRYGPTNACLAGYLVSAITLIVLSVLYWRRNE